MRESLAYDLDELAIDVFQIAEDGLEVESFVEGHGMTETAASLCSSHPCSGSCCCCFDPV
jgi:hypothetical protein